MRLLLPLIFLLCSTVIAEPVYRTIAKKSNYSGFDRYDFTIEGHKCYVIEPKKAADGKPWVWRARFDSKAFGNFDKAMLEEGYHVAKINVAGLFGNSKAMKNFDFFYKYCTEKVGLGKKPILEGLSRGGLPIFNWSVNNLDKVSCVYADAAVCDFKSWPGGKMKGKGSAGNWKTCITQYGLSEEEAMKYDKNPVDTIHILGKAQIPVIFVVGDADKVVPHTENALVMEKNYNAAIPEGGMKLKVISKAGIGHHPHGLKDPAPVVKFAKEAVAKMK